METYLNIGVITLHDNADDLSSRHKNSLAALYKLNICHVLKKD